MRPIPTRLRSLLEAMPRMRQCELKWADQGACVGRIQWHHVWTYGDKGQINEVWAILGVCEIHHERVKTTWQVREYLERRTLELATKSDLAKYPKKDWLQLKKYLKHKLIHTRQ